MKMRFKTLIVYILAVHCWTTLTAKLCPVLQKSEGVQITCASPEGKELNCTADAVPGSTAIFTCLPYYFSDRESVSMKCRPSGNWFPHRTFQCDIDCGKQEQQLQALIAHGYLTDTIKWPWHAAIFRKTLNKNPTNNEDYEYICGGSILTSSTILTAAHCVTLPNSKAASPTIFKVVLGSVSSHYDQNTLANSKAKVFSVNSLEYHTDYNPLTFEADIAILQLSQRIIFDSNIRPVCFPRGQGKHLRLSNHHLNTGNIGFVVGYGLDETRELSNELKEAQLPIVSTGVCSESLGRTHSHTQYCAGYTNGTAVCSGDSGGGMYFPFESGSDTTINTRYMVQGLVSYARRGRCDSFSVFTKVVNFADWLEQELAKFSVTFIPSESEKSDTKSDQKHCGPLAIPLNGQIDCYQDSSRQATKISCAEANRDAVAKFSCAKNFIVKMRAHQDKSEGADNFATCRPNGQWTPIDFQCEPECGLATTPKMGKDAAVVVAEPMPWHARIYGIRRGVNGAKSQLIQLCSGSLIETSFILTSAGCITGDTGSLLPIRHFKIVLGTNSSNHLTDFRSPHIQIFDVKKMWVPQTFVKSEKTADIALVQLQGEAKLSDYVKRVCYLREGEYQEDIVFGSWGKSANFLKTVERKDFDGVRHAVTFSSSECNTVEMKVPPRSFCSPVKRGDVVCKNDTGHGLVFSQQLNVQLHVLKGVLSHVGSMPSDPRPCLVASYVAYTQVEAFGAWLLEIISNINNENESS